MSLFDYTNKFYNHFYLILKSDIEYDYYYGVKQITIQELKAINKKCEELNWLDE